MCARVYVMQHELSTLRQLRHVNIDVVLRCFVADGVLWCVQPSSPFGRWHTLVVSSFVTVTLHDGTARACLQKQWSHALAMLPYKFMLCPSFAVPSCDKSAFCYDWLVQYCYDKHVQCDHVQ